MLNYKTNRCNIATVQNIKKNNELISKIKSPSIKIPSSIKSPSRKIIKKNVISALNRAPSNFDERIKKYNMYYKYLSKYNINQCLNIEGKKNDNITYSLANDNIKLVKKIGKDGAYGAIYESKGKSEGELFKFASKIMEVNDDNLNEIKILKEVTNIVLRKNNPHFPIMYYNFICNNLQENANLPPYVNNKKYYVNINELASGDASEYILNNNMNEILMNNAIVQIFISIFSFHSIGYIHTDTHWGNFLYHKVKPGGFIQYIINGRDLYIPNIGYLWVIWDFSFVDKFTTKDYMTDYLLIMNSLKLFRNESVDKINDILTVEYKKKNKINADALFNLFIDNTKLFLKSVDLPKNAVIINGDNPYKI